MQLPLFWIHIRLVCTRLAMSTSCANFFSHSLWCALDLWLCFIFCYCLDATRTYTSPSTFPPTTTTYPPTVTDSCLGVCERPKLLVSLENTTRTAGNTISNLCLARESEVMYRWYKDGLMLSQTSGKIEISMGGSTLSILDAQPDDSGWYACEAANEYGSSFTRGFIYVIGLQCSTKFNHLQSLTFPMRL